MEAVAEVETERISPVRYIKAIDAKLGREISDKEFLAAYKMWQRGVSAEDAAAELRTEPSPFPAGRPEVGRNHNSLPPAPLCVQCDDATAVDSGFCRSCADEIKKDIAMQDIIPTRSKRSMMDAQVRQDDARLRKQSGGAE